MCYFIIIRGPLGVGKTTIAKGLADKLGGVHISIDKVLAKHKLDKVSGRCIPLKNFIKANEIVIPKVRKLLESKVVIFDGNFYHKQQITHLIKKLRYPCFVFTLKAPLKVCIERDKCRKKVYGEGAACAVHNLVSKFDYGRSINTEGKTEKQIIKKILGFL